MTAVGATLKITFGRAGETLTERTSEIGPVFAGSQPGIARTRWKYVPGATARNDAAVELVSWLSRIVANDEEVERSTR